MDVDAHDKAERALEVVRELHKRYKAQDERWHNYLKLIGFIAFAGLLLSVIYLQRDAHVLYQVHSTIAAGVLPDPATISSPQDVMNWMKQFLQVRFGFHISVLINLSCRHVHALGLHAITMVKSVAWSHVLTTWSQGLDDM